MFPRVLTAIPNDDFTVSLSFSNGETGRFDLKPHLEHGVFSALKDPVLFRQIRVSLGTVECPVR